MIDLLLPAVLLPPLVLALRSRGPRRGLRLSLLAFLAANAAYVGLVVLTGGGRP